MDILRNGNGDNDDLQPVMEDEENEDYDSPSESSSDSEELDDSPEIKQKPKSQPKSQPKIHIPENPKSKPKSGLLPKKLMPVGRHSKNESAEVAALKDKRAKIVRNMNEQNRDSSALKLVELDLKLFAEGENDRNIANKSAEYYMWLRDVPVLCRNILMDKSPVQISNEYKSLINQYQDKIYQMIKRIPKIKTSNQKPLLPRQQFIRKYALNFLLDKLLQSGDTHRKDVKRHWNDFHQHQQQQKRQPQKRKQVRSCITAAQALRAIYNRVPDLDSENNPHHLNTRIIKVIQHLAQLAKDNKCKKRVIYEEDEDDDEGEEE